MSLYARLALPVAARPDAPALVCAGRPWTYAQFDAEIGAWLADVQAWRPSTSLLVPAAMRALIELRHRPRPS